MIRKMLVIAAAVAMPVSVIAATGGVAGAKAATGIAGDSISCTSLSATVHLSPPLTPNGVTSGPPATTTITSTTGSLAGCTVTKGAVDGVALTNVTGTISATLHAKKAPSAKHPGSTCAGLLSATKESGNITVAWHSSTAGAPAIPSTVISVKSVTASAPTSGGNAGHGVFAVAGKNSGSFLGADKGKTSSLTARTVQTTAQLATACTPSPGISSVPVQAGSSPITFK
jgi:hypothetical protein